VSALTRRRLLGQGALVVAFSLSRRAMAQVAEKRPALPGDLDKFPLLDSWIRIDADGHITVFTGKAELGQGLKTALIQVAADELAVPPASIELVTADTAHTPDEGVTAGSHSMQDSGTAILNAAANVRVLLTEAAAWRWLVAVEQVELHDGAAHAPNGDSLGYGELATLLSLHVEAKPDVARREKGVRLIGTDLPRIDILAKVSGGAAYVQDMRLPGMVHARVVRPPGYGAELIACDASAVEKMPGVVKVVREGKFVGVVAKTEWAAIKAARALKVTWSKPTTELPANAEELYAYLKSTKPMRSQKVVEKGNVDSTLAQAKKSYSRPYRWPLQLHGMIGPSCAIADVKSDKATIWCGTQGPFRSRKNIATLLKLPEKDVRVIYYEGSGSYGRLATEDAGEDARDVARALIGTAQYDKSRDERKRSR